MDNFSGIEKVNIKNQIEEILALLADDNYAQELNVGKFADALERLRTDYLTLSRVAWFSQLHEIFIVFLNKSDHSYGLMKIKYQLISFWHKLSVEDKFRIANPVGKRIVYPRMDKLDARQVDERIQDAIEQGEIENCADLISVAEVDQQRLTYFAAEGFKEPIFELNYNEDEGVIDFFNTNAKYEGLRKHMIIMIHDVVILV